MKTGRGWVGWVLLAVLAGLATSTGARAEVVGRMVADPDLRLGLTEDGRPQVFAPGFAPGSGISHWDPRATPDLLMEPALTPGLLPGDLDLTPALMEDLGWSRGSSSFEILDGSEEGEGFDDPTPFAGAPGNAAATLGEARRNTFQAALGTWAETVESDVPIEVLVIWDELFCEPGIGAVLGATGLGGVVRDLPGLPEPGVWYPQPLAEALVGADLSAPGEPDLLIVLNSALDAGCLGEGTGWYYGMDGNEPETALDLMPVLLHEVGHGLGMATLANPFTLAFPEGLPGIYDTLLFDTLTGRSWVEMTDRERLFASGHFGRLVWNGPRATDEARKRLQGGSPRIDILQPSELAGSFPAGPALFGPPAEPAVEGPVVCMLDGEADFSHLNGCSEAVTPQELSGAIALVDVGDCLASKKVAEAQAAGAVGVWIVYNAGDVLPVLGGLDEGIEIPSVGIPAPLGSRLRQEICPETAAYLADERFQISATWRTGEGDTGTASARPVTADTTTFYFFAPDNLELIVKMVDACELPDFQNFWIFAAGLTNVEVALSVIDTETGLRRVFESTLGEAFPPFQDTVGFRTCPP